ncbi:MAG TPA: hypothetical protein VF797_21495, partial [Noviherbaspirillum sp.]
APAATAASPAVPAPAAPVARAEGKTEAKTEARIPGANVISASSKNITRIVTPAAAAAEVKK